MKYNADSVMEFTLRISEMYSALYQGLVKEYSSSCYLIKIERNSERPKVKIGIRKKRYIQYEERITERL
jgi:hypothetical protein